MKNIKVTFLPADIIIEVPAETTISEAALNAGIKLRQGCSGKKVCGLCRVKITEGLFGPGKFDVSNLTGKEISEGYRLGCRTKMTSDTVVELSDLPVEQGLTGKGTITETDLAVEPYIYAQPLSLTPPSLSDNLGDLDRVIRHLGEDKQCLDVDIKSDFLHHLSGTLRSSDWNICAVLMEDQMRTRHITLVDVVPLKAEKIPELYGIVFDIGTTTITGYLINLNNGKHVFNYSIPNPQGVYGSDVITRLKLCVDRDEEGIGLMHDAVVKGCRIVLKRLCENAHIDLTSIYSITVAANTVMQHLLLTLNPKRLAEAPYSPVNTIYPLVDACNFGLLDKEDCSHYVPLLNLPGSSGYFGSDAVGTAFFALNAKEGLKDQSQPAVVIDIGTNSEVVLILPDGRILGCSTAAGPAFEGAHIKFGMPAVVNAVTEINIDSGKFQFGILKPDGGIGFITEDSAEQSPRGLMGTALIDITALLLQQNIITETGKIEAVGEFGTRVRTGTNGQPEFVVFKGKGQDGKSGSDPSTDLILTQEDVRQIQLAKGAVKAGILVLMEKAKVDKESIKEVLLAGVFGTLVNTGSVRSIGLVPDLPNSEIRAIGNAAGAGAVMTAVSKTYLREFCELAAKIEYIELATETKFNDYFIKSMGFF